MHEQLNFFDYSPTQQEQPISDIPQREPPNPHLVLWLERQFSFYRKAMLAIANQAISDPGPEWKQRMRRHEMSRLHEMALVVQERLTNL
jgi:hypothetical protein